MQSFATIIMFDLIWTSQNQKRFLKSCIKIFSSVTPVNKELQKAVNKIMLRKHQYKMLIIKYLSLLKRVLVIYSLQSSA